MLETAARVSDWRAFEKDGGVCGHTRCGRGETGKVPTEADCAGEQP